MAATEPTTRAPSRWRSPPPDHPLPRGQRPPRRPAVEEQDAGVTDLLRSLADDTRTLVRQELDLARMEVVRTARHLTVDGIWIAAGAGIAALGGVVVVLGLALLVGYFLDSYWLGTLIVGGFLLLVGAVGALVGVQRLRSRELAPKRTVDSLRADATWARTEADDFKQALKE